MRRWDVSVSENEARPLMCGGVLLCVTVWLSFSAFHFSCALCEKMSLQDL